MYQEMFVYRVPLDRVEDFERVVQQAIDAFQRHGAIGGTLIRLSDGAARYGCAGAEDALLADTDGALYVELAHFHDAAHYAQVTASAEEDPEIVDMFDILVKTVNIGQVVRGEFTTAISKLDVTQLARHSATGLAA